MKNQKLHELSKKITENKVKSLDNESAMMITGGTGNLSLVATCGTNDCWGFSASGCDKNGCWSYHDKVVAPSSLAPASSSPTAIK
ncbi:hypothetical protein [Chryseobacterium takakiae]|jgi:hypothetical protein|uniref:Uncharacterized protein n=1 Tax=Chryseobacterium takakiae TaxID=1302685 RepID=A0A1M4Y029_9FLAO|nr:hypothetical protein [Chryseobacterium takakiae]SHE99187.1 hypothetical protein SAMN05444408_10745 [Chryseobacterium takakiae]